jgi:hypothetical protein
MVESGADTLTAARQNGTLQKVVAIQKAFPSSPLLSKLMAKRPLEVRTLVQRQFCKHSIRSNSAQTILLIGFLSNATDPPDRFPFECRRSF